METRDFPVLLYDGLCGLCNNSINFILRNEKSSQLKFAPLQSDFAARLIEKLDIPKELDSVIVIFKTADGKFEYLSRSGAIFHILHYLKSGFSIFKILKIIPDKLLDSFYDLTTKNRKFFWKQYKSCELPSNENRRRFIGL